MNHPRQDKYVMMAVVTGFTIQFACYLFASVFLTPDFSGEFPVYSQESNLIIEFGMALNMASSTVMGIKLGDERKILASAGFTMFAIAIGLSMSSLFEVIKVIDRESFEKSYFINTCSNFLYVPAILLISTYENFKSWVRYLNLITVIPILASALLFMFYYRNFIILDLVTLVGYILLAFAQLMWAVNVYQNYKAASRAHDKVLISPN